jgi:transcriptional regulator with XRE-family HTH domain
VALKVIPRTRRALVEIGNRIREAREAAGISQETLATRIEMTRTNYARIEHGKANVTIDSLMRIAKGLDLDLDVALRRRAAKKPG